MTSINQMLDSIKQHHELRSDYKLALFLGIGEGNIANYRHGRSLPDERACEKIANAIKIDPDVLIAEMNSQRAKTPELRATWSRIAARLQTGVATAAAAILTVCVSMLFIALSPTDTRANERPVTTGQPVSLLYIV